MGFTEINQHLYKDLNNCHLTMPIKENFPSYIFLGKFFVFLFKIGKTVKHERNANTE